MRCPKCDCKESRLISIEDLKGGSDSYSKSVVSIALLDQAAAAKQSMDGSQIYCTWCGYLVYQDEVRE